MATKAVFVPKGEVALVEGARVLGIQARSPQEVIERVQEGFPGSSFEHLAGLLGLPAQKLLVALMIPSRTTQRKKAEGKPLPTETSQTLLRAGKIYERATRLLGSEPRARRWITSTPYSLGGKTPLELAATEPGGELVLDLLEALSDGGAGA